MNDEPLTPDHGYPLRIVVPGYSGVRWVKWLDTITVSRRESDNFYQQKDYKILPATVRTHEQADKEGWWAKLPALQSNPINSVIGEVQRREDGTLEVVGYAVSGAAGGQVKRVEVSANRGKTWEEAEITYQEGKWSWTLWRATVPVAQEGASDEERVVWSRATDESGRTQALSMDWNLRGVGYNAYGEAHY